MDHGRIERSEPKPRKFYLRDIRLQSGWQSPLCKILPSASSSAPSGALTLGSPFPEGRTRGGDPGGWRADSSAPELLSEPRLMIGSSQLGFRAGRNSAKRETKMPSCIFGDTKSTDPSVLHSGFHLARARCRRRQEEHGRAVELQLHAARAGALCRWLACVAQVAQHRGSLRCETDVHS